MVNTVRREAQIGFARRRLQLVDSERLCLQTLQIWCLDMGCDIARVPCVTELQTQGLEMRQRDLTVVLLVQF